MKYPCCFTTAGVFSLIGKQDDNNLYSMMLSVDLLRIMWFYIIPMLKISTLRWHILNNGGLECFATPD